MKKMMVIVVMLYLTACGGGGSDTNTATDTTLAASAPTPIPTPTPAPTTITISGKVTGVPGGMSIWLRCVTKVDNPPGVIGCPVAGAGYILDLSPQAVTDADGDYTISSVRIENRNGLQPIPPGYVWMLVPYFCTDPIDMYPPPPRTHACSPVYRNYLINESVTGADFVMWHL